MENKGSPKNIVTLMIQGNGRVKWDLKNYVNII